MAWPWPRRGHGRVPPPADQAVCVARRVNSRVTGWLTHPDAIARLPDPRGPCRSIPLACGLALFPPSRATFPASLLRRPSPTRAGTGASTDGHGHPRARRGVTSPAVTNPTPSPYPIPIHLSRGWIAFRLGPTPRRRRRQRDGGCGAACQAQRVEFRCGGSATQRRARGLAALRVEPRGRTDGRVRFSRSGRDGTGRDRSETWCAHSRVRCGGGSVRGSVTTRSSLRSHIRSSDVKKTKRACVNSAHHSTPTMIG